MKTCSKCSLSKVEAEFYSNRSQKDGLQGWCISCLKESLRRNPEAHLSASRRWKKRNPEKVKKNRRDNTLSVYGLSTDEFLKLLADQNFKCKICQELLGTRVPVDHDHKTNRIRGVLCQQCNLGLGMFKDSPEKLRAAADYLERK